MLPASAPRRAISSPVWVIVRIPDGWGGAQDARGAPQIRARRRIPLSPVVFAASARLDAFEGERGLILPAARHLALDPAVGLLETASSVIAAPSRGARWISVLSLLRPRTPCGASSW